MTERSVNKARVEITLAQPAVIVFNEWFTPAWKARVNGVSEEVVRVNQWQVGIPVGGGKNEIEFTYRPAVSAALLVVNRVTWLLLGLFLVGRFHRLPVAQMESSPGRGAHPGVIRSASAEQKASPTRAGRKDYSRRRDRPPSPLRSNAFEEKTPARGKRENHASPIAAVTPAGTHWQLEGQRARTPVII